MSSLSFVHTRLVRGLDRLAPDALLLLVARLGAAATSTPSIW
jgi:hypothetical protein